MANSISGNILNQAGAGVTGVTVSWTGPASGSTTSAGGGAWTTGVTLGPGTYIVTASATGRQFQPASQTEVIVSTNISGVNFTTETIEQAGSSWLTVNTNNSLRGSKSH